MAPHQLLPRRTPPPATVAARATALPGPAQPAQPPTPIFHPSTPPHCPRVQPASHQQSHPALPSPSTPWPAGTSPTLPSPPALSSSEQQREPASRVSQRSRSPQPLAATAPRSKGAGTVRKLRYTLCTAGLLTRFISPPQSFHSLLGIKSNPGSRPSLDYLRLQVRSSVWRPATAATSARSPRSVVSCLVGRVGVLWVCRLLASVNLDSGPAPWRWAPTAPGALGALCSPPACLAACPAWWPGLLLLACPCLVPTL